MKIILTGSTGFIGNEVLTAVLANPKFTTIVALSRRPLPSTIAESQKLKTVIMEDFTSYPPSVMAELSGAEACIWNLGVKNTSIATHRNVTINYTTAAISAFEKLGSASKPFRFVFMSGILAVRDQEKSIWIYGEQRKLKGEAENLLLKANSMTSGVDAYVLRPAGVLERRGASGVLAALQSLGPSIRVDALAAAAIELAVNGGGKKILENGDLVRLGNDLLSVR